MRGSIRKQTPDLIGAALLIALGVAFAIGSVRYGLLGNGGRIGPGFAPFICGVCLAVFGGSIGVQTWQRREESALQPSEEQRPESSTLGERPSSTAERDEEQEQEMGTSDKEGSNRSVALVFGLMLVAILLTPVLGFLVSFGLLVLALVTLVERQNFLVGLALSIVATAATWLVFGHLLQVPLPPGVIGSGFGG